jgi:sterol desaturase/sphingolipid hydroxylase (fatty acid hydroxylase superfamily)
MATLWEEVMALPPGGYHAWLQAAHKEGPCTQQLVPYLPQLDWLSRSSVATPLVNIAPQLVWLLAVQGVHQLPAAALLLHVLLGMAAWTAFEYVLHRWVFHADAWAPDWRAVRAAHMFLHGFHHKFPADAGRMFIPTAGAWVLSAAAGWALRGWLALPAVRAIAAAFLASYAAYEYAHFVCHSSLGEGFLWVRALRRQHLRHHFVYGGRAAFGVSTPLMDVLAGTSGCGYSGHAWPSGERN